MKGDKKTILAVVLIIVAIGVVAYQILGVSSSATRAASTAIAAPTSSPSTPVPPMQRVATQDQQAVAQPTAYEKLISNISERDLAFRSVAFHNPMTPLVAGSQGGSAATAESESADVVSGYSVKGIIWNENHPLALINDQVVGVGERLDDGALITNISSDSVKFTKRGNRYVLVLREE